MTSGIRHALDVLFPSGGVVELRALTDHAIHSGYFDNFDELVRKAESLEAIPEVAGIYVTLNEVEPALLSRRATGSR